MTQQKQTPPQAPPPGREVARTEEEQKKDTMTDLARFFGRKDVHDRIQQVLPKHLSPDRIIRIGLHAAQRSPNLWQVKPMELFGGILFFASVGLEPNSPLAHGDLVPVPKRAQVNGRYETIGYTLETFIRYGGWLELMRRSGSLLSVHCDIVLAGDDFEFEHGSNAHLRHKPQPFDFDPDSKEGLEYDWAYSFFKLRDGVEHFEVLPRSRILAIRNQAPSYRQAKADLDNDRAPDWKKDKARKAPWIAWEIPMAKKTMLLQGRKWVPISVEVMNAFNLEAAQAEGKSLDLAGVANFDLKDGLELPLREDTDDEPKQIAQSDEKPIVVTAEPEKKTEPVVATKVEPKPQVQSQPQKESPGDPRPEPHDGPTLDLQPAKAAAKPAAAAAPKRKTSFA